MKTQNKMTKHKWLCLKCKKEYNSDTAIKKVNKEATKRFGNMFTFLETYCPHCNTCQMNHKTKKSNVKYIGELK